MQIKQNLTKTCKEMYAILSKYAVNIESKRLIPKHFDPNGKLDGEISEELQKQLEQEEEDESETQKAKKDAKKGGGAGGGTGEELNAPEPDFSAYYKLVEENKPEIEKLLNNLFYTS